MWDSLITQLEAAATQSGAGALKQTIDNAIPGASTPTPQLVQQLVQKVEPPWLQNFGVLLVGIALFVLGAGMIIFATLEDAVSLYADAQKKVSSVAGAAATIGIPVIP